MPTEKVNEHTRRDWRRLGFYYDRDDSSNSWKIIGSRKGLRAFRDILVAYVAAHDANCDSDHEHYGPYMYLEVRTAESASITKHTIQGALADLDRLAKLVEESVSGMKPLSTMRIQDEFAPGSPYALVLEMRDDDFDPASADPMLR
jgi:hypothetical protein